LQEKVNLYRRHTGIGPDLGRKGANKWLIETWVNKSDEYLKRTDSNFYLTPEWLSLRKKVFAMYGRRCMKCGSLDFLAVDHINPRSLYPELELLFDNLQVLCRICNSQKSNRQIFDLRPINK